MAELIFDKTEDWEKRTLCIDESCIGTIGADGRCRECGKAYRGALNYDTATVEENREPSKAVLADVNKSAEETVSDNEWEKRTLCIDESCIGTIGVDGRCRECGKPGELEG